MHDHYLNILQDFREELLQQRPALAAEMEVQLRNMSQIIKATMQGESLYLDTPHLDRVRLEGLRYGSFEGSLPSDTHSRRSQSLGGFTVTENHTEAEEGEDLPFTEGILSVSRRPRSLLNARESAWQSQTTEMLLQHEPTVSLQVSHRQKRQCRRPCSCQCQSSRHLTFYVKSLGSFLWATLGSPTSHYPAMSMLAHNVRRRWSGSSTLFLCGRSSKE